MHAHPNRIWLTVILAAGLTLTTGCPPNGGAGFGSRNQDENVWAIRALVVRGPQRQQTVARYADALRNVPDLNPKLVNVFDEGGEATLYYGEFRREYDFASGREQFQPDPSASLSLIRQLSFNTNDAGRQRTVWPFQFATLGALPVGGTTTNPNWNLAAAKGFYSLQVAVFYNTDDMKQRRYAAEEYCSVLRERGEEAYYYHGPVNSIVTIGAFPESAVQLTQETNEFTGVTTFEPVMVGPLRDLQKRFPNHLHNGHIMNDVGYSEETGERLKIPHVSFAVEIPRANSSFETDTPQNTSPW